MGGINPDAIFYQAKREDIIERKKDTQLETAKIYDGTK